MKHDVKIFGWGWLCCRNADGSIAWKVDFQNMPTNQGLDYLGGIMFANSGGAFPQINNWYIGVIDLIGFTTLSSSDTMVLHPGWKESLLYSGNRPNWANSEGGQQVSSNGPFTFPITGTGNIVGMFASSGNVQGSTSGILWATAQLPVTTAVTPGQSLTGSYNIAFSGS